jgi:CubicO group peptidase (beta-lactamase class C family)
MNMLRRHVMELVALQILVVPIIAAQPSTPPDLDAYVERIRRQFEVPGIGLTIVKDGKVLVAKGYGIRKMGSPEPVDAGTVFAIASNTKAFTATALGMLVEEGKIEWDAPVIRYLPWFRVSNPYVTVEMTVRDLLVHRSGLGLGAGDLLLWPGTDLKQREIVQHLANVPLSASFRSRYAYDNILYLAAGELIEAVTGQNWHDFIRTRILDKLGMRETGDRHSDITRLPNAAVAHARIDGTVRPVNPFVSENSDAAGGIVTNARDYAKWLIVQLDSGRTAAGTRLFAPSTTRQLWSVVTPLPVGPPAPELNGLRSNFSGYGLGFGIRDYRGYKLVSHSGSLSGFVSRIAMIPELRLGVAVFTNQESEDAYNALICHILDYYIGGGGTDWIRAFAAVKARADSSLAVRESKTVSERDTLSRPSLPMEKYAGEYEDAWYGPIPITMEGHRLVMRMSHSPGMVGDLEHWQYDTFVVRWRDRELRADAFVTFTLTAEGKIDHATMKAVSPATDFSFDFQDLILKPAARK